MAASTRKIIPLAEAAELTATGDLWLFRGKSAADRAIRLFTNAPVNHVAVALTLDDLPPLLWHAELGKSTEDVWVGEPQRGAQLHRLTDAVGTWVERYGQRPYFRQLDTVITPTMEDEFLRVVNEHDGQHFPRTGALIRRVALGRLRRAVSLEDVFCAELAAITYQRMGLLGSERPLNWYDPGRFWSGDHLELAPGAVLGEEIEVLV